MSGIEVSSLRDFRNVKRRNVKHVAFAIDLVPKTDEEIKKRGCLSHEPKTNGRKRKEKMNKVIPAPVSSPDRSSNKDSKPRARRKKF